MFSGRANIDEEAIDMEEEEDDEVEVFESPRGSIHPRSNSSSLSRQLAASLSRPSLASHSISALPLFNSDPPTRRMSTASIPPGAVRSRAGSGEDEQLTSPPPPPPNFNPPADLPPPPIEAVTPPVSNPTSEAGSTISLPSAFLLETSLNRRPSITDNAAGSSSQSMRRPDIRALQRASGDSVPTVPISGASSFSSMQSTHSGTSEAGEHLVEARERLLQGTIPDEEDGARRPSDPFELHVTNPTPPLAPARVGDTPPVEDSPGTTDPVPEGPVERAWDSVWPAPGTAPLPPPPEAPLPTFPIAPISPFVTPIFSSAIASLATSTLARPSSTPSTSSRSSSVSPTEYNSPFRTSPQGPTPIPISEARIGDSSIAGRRSSFVVHPPLLAHASPSSAVAIRHQRAQSSSTLSNFNQPSAERRFSTPPASPLGSPTRRAVSLNSATGRVKDADSPRPSSPLRKASRRQPSANTASAGRLLDLDLDQGEPEASSSTSPKPRGPHSLRLERVSSADSDPGLANRASPRRLADASSAPAPRPHLFHRSSSTSDPLPAVSDHLLPSTPFTPIYLPPPVVTQPLLGSTSSLSSPDVFASSTPAAPQASTSQVTTRPAVLRRAVSDYDAKHQAHPSIPFSRSLTSVSEADIGLNRFLDDASVHSTGSPRSPRTTQADISRSPRRSPVLLPSKALFTSASPPASPTKGPRQDTSRTTFKLSQMVDPIAPASTGIEIVDEGDVLPPADAIEEIPIDVTFDDEGLSTLERIFLLSKSDFPFHRAYVARVLGDLLYDVDPCEAVEYVLPLLSGFTMDGDETVREAFASELHRILWYFFTNCKVTVDDIEETSQDMSPNRSQGTMLFRQASKSSSDGHSGRRYSSVEAESTSDLPILQVAFFTPLLGALLLSSNPVVSDSCRNCVVNLVGRLRDKVTFDNNIWGIRLDDAEARHTRLFASQSGDHSHHFPAFDLAARRVVEDEFINGIVIGMGSLATEMPDVFSSGDSSSPDRDPAEELQAAREKVQYQEQLIAEATAGRATSMNLIGSLCEFYTGEEAVAKGFASEILRCPDGDHPVRAEGALAMSYFAKIAPVEQIYQLIPVFEALMLDEMPHVRQSLTLSLPAICRRIESPDYQRTFAVKAVQALTDTHDEVRIAALEILGQVIHVFADDPRGPPSELLHIFTDDSEEPEGLDGDWHLIASFNFPGVCLTLGADRWHELLGLYTRLQARAGPKIMCTLAAALHELSKILHQDQVDQDLLPVIYRSFQFSEDTRERVYEHIDVLLERMNPKTSWETLRLLLLRWDEGSLGGWRARERMALHIPSFFRLFPNDQVLRLTKNALLDPFAAVRDAATKGIPEAYLVLMDSPVIARAFHEMLLDLGDSSSFRERITFVRCLREFARPPPNRRAFEEFFVPVLPRLSTDVVDVRLALAQTVANLFVVGAYYADAILPRDVPRSVVQLANLLADDESIDVRDTVRHINLETTPRDDLIPYHIQPPSFPGRALYDDNASPTGRGHPDQSGDPARRRSNADLPAHLSGMRLGYGEDKDMVPTKLHSPKDERLDPFTQVFTSTQYSSRTS